MEEKKTKLIKRYQNRKLYDTCDSCYVTLEDIAEMIKLGEEVKIIDNTNKEDITKITLAQIIFEEQKRKTNTLPLSTFTELIRSGGGVIRELVSKTIETGVREFDQVREFVDEKIKPTVEGVQNIPSLQDEIEKLKNKIDALEKEVTKDRPQTRNHKEDKR